MIAVLAEGGELRVKDVYERVVEVLGDPAPSYDHVGGFLNYRSRGDRRLFVRVGFGRYRLVEPEDRF